DGDLPDPPASPGDTLNVDLTGTTNPMLTANPTATGYQGSWTFTDHQPANFQRIETVGNTADLRISYTTPESAPESSDYTFHVSATNNGPSDATNVTITARLPLNVTNIRPNFPQNANVSVSGNIVTITFSTVLAGTTVGGTITVFTPPDEGT